MNPISKRLDDWRIHSSQKMRYTENIKNRIFLIAASIASYFLIPIPLGLMVFTFFNPPSFPFAGYVVYAIQICVSLILLYGAFEWVKPSLIPRNFPKKFIGFAIVGIVFTTTFLSILPSNTISLESVGSCTIYDNSPSSRMVSNNGRSTHQECIDSCIHAGESSNRYNQIYCEFEAVGNSWSKTPEDLLGFKPTE